MNTLPISLVNDYLAHKQHLLPTSDSLDVAKVVRDIVALHATRAAGPYLSLWARVPDFLRQTLQDALYERRELVRVLCMRTTLHIVPSDELPLGLPRGCHTFTRRMPDVGGRLSSGMPRTC